MTLEKRIETAIAENADPFTTDADIRFFETEEWTAAKVTLGTKIIGDFGGYEPLWEGEVVTISTYNIGPTTPEVKVNWDNGSHTWVLMSEIDAWGKKSKIGYYTEEGYYE
jgi:hypothetical protein